MRSSFLYDAAEGTKARAATGTQTTMHGSLLTAMQGTAALASEICVGLRCLMYYVDIAACIVYVFLFVCIVLTYHITP